MQKEITRQKAKEAEKRTKDKRKMNLWWLVIFFCALAAVVAAVVAYDKDGNAEMLPERKQKLDEELAKYDKAEQYVLVARNTGIYSCPSCVGTDSVFLFEGEIWKYGVSINGKSRYSFSFLDTKGLNYFTEYVGEIGECLKQEKIKIYTYPTLPENLKRKVKLLRPPGNLVDR